MAPRPQTGRDGRLGKVDRISVLSDVRYGTCGCPTFNFDKNIS
jgi:hypothetical protein